MNTAGHVPHRFIYPALIKFLTKQIERLTLRVNMGVNPATAAAPRADTKDDGKANNSGCGGGGAKKWNSTHATQASTGGGNKNAQAGNKQVNKSFKNSRTCEQCGKLHPFLFYCEKYIKANIKGRIDMRFKQRTCQRCLSMGRKMEGKRDQWWPDHDSYCSTNFVCEVDSCAQLPREQQRHITICGVHAKDNKANQDDFIKKLNPNELPKGIPIKGLSFFYADAPALQFPLQGDQGIIDAETYDKHGFKIIPDVTDNAAFMLQFIPSELDPSLQLLVFYDSGCSAATLSDRAY